MKSPTHLLQRRSVLALSAWSLVSCGGGSAGGGTAGLPGTGGTGIFAMGSISGFGSVIVNGIRFDDVQAAVMVDGFKAAPADLRLGMVASVQGTRGADVLLGTAHQIDVWSIAHGTVVLSGNGQFAVLGMTIQTDASTVLDGLAAGALPAPGQSVTVWGLQSDVAGGIWKATRVVAGPPAQAVVSGLVNLVGSQRMLNGLVLTGPLASTLPAGQLVRVQGTLTRGDSHLEVQQVRGSGLASVPAADVQGEIEIEGVATTAVRSGLFKLGDITVDIGSAVVQPNAAGIVVGARMEVYGQWIGGILKAREVAIEDALVAKEIEVKGRIDQFSSLASFVVRGQLCDASATPGLSAATRAALKVGSEVELKGIRAGSVLQVTRLSLED